MIKSLVILVSSILVISGITAGAVMVNTSAHDGPKPEKPILLMTPSDLFPNLQLRMLAMAAQHGNVKKIDTLIAQGVDVNGRGRYGITPLFSAWQARNKKGFEALLDHGADPNNISADGHTLLNEIAGASDPYFLKLALKYGANPNLVAPRLGETPLFPAAQFLDGNVNVPILIKAGGNLNHQRKPLMKTAMMDAASVGHFNVVYELLVAGANYKLKDVNGHDVRYWIRRSRADYQPLWRERIIGFLKQHNFWNDNDPKQPPDNQQPN